MGPLLSKMCLGQLLPSLSIQVPRRGAAVACGFCYNTRHETDLDLEPRCDATYE
jgi:hypothetical protein